MLRLFFGSDDPVNDTVNEPVKIYLCSDKRLKGVTPNRHFMMANAGDSQTPVLRLEFGFKSRLRLFIFKAK